MKITPKNRAELIESLRQFGKKCKFNLRGANLRGADLHDANLYGANLRCANLHGANLYGANLYDAYLRGAHLSFFQLCPDAGSFQGWKKLADGRLCQLEICADALRTSSLGGRKCRCSKAKVLAIWDADKDPIEKGFSTYDGNFVYEVGKIVEVVDYDSDIRVECTRGIHFFITRAEAEEY